MNVLELRQALEVMPPDAEIITEGCDCYGDCILVELETIDDTDQKPTRALPNPTGRIWDYPQKKVVILKRSP